MKGEYKLGNNSNEVRLRPGIEIYSDESNGSGVQIYNAGENTEIQQDADIRQKQSDEKYESLGTKNAVKRQLISCRKLLILLMAFWTSVITTGFAFNMSVLYVEWLDAFGRPNSETSLVQSICSGMFSITGFGLSICHICAYTSISYHFDGRSKIFALTLMEVGSGVGAAILPIILEIFIVKYGWRGTLLLIGGIMFNLVVFASTYTIPREKNNDNPATRKGNKLDLLKHKTKSSRNEKALLLLRKFQLNLNGRLCKVLTALFVNIIFWLYTLSMALGLATFNAWLIFLIDYFQSIGISRRDAVLIYLYSSIVNTVCRFCPGLLVQIPHISVLFIGALSSLVGSISTAAFPLVKSSFILTLIAACGFRMGMANIVTVTAIAPVKLVQKEHYSAGIGISVTAVGIVQITLGPIFGYIRDVTGDYDASFYCAAVILFVSSVLFITTMVYRHYIGTKHGEQNVTQLCETTDL